jgi:hypothetical protein
VSVRSGPTNPIVPRAGQCRASWDCPAPDRRTAPVFPAGALELAPARSCSNLLAL